jgi:hypothetical protein
MLSACWLSNGVFVASHAAFMDFRRSAPGRTCPRFDPSIGTGGLCNGQSTPAHTPTLCHTALHHSHAKTIAPYACTRTHTSPNLHLVSFILPCHRSNATTCTLRFAHTLHLNRTWLATFFPATCSNAITCTLGLAHVFFAWHFQVLFIFSHTCVHSCAHTPTCPLRCDRHPVCRVLSHLVHTLHWLLSDVMDSWHVIDSWHVMDSWHVTDSSRVTGSF